MSSDTPKKRGRKPGSKSANALPAASRVGGVKRTVTLDDLPAINVEGGLFTVEHIRKVARLEAASMEAKDYDLPPGPELRQEISRAFTIGAALWKDFLPKVTGAAETTEVTRAFLADFLKQVLGYGQMGSLVSTLDGVDGPVMGRTAFGGAVPLVLSGTHLDLDKPDAAFAVGFRRRSPHQALQETLNSQDSSLWGVCSNGLRLRILRDSDSLTRQSSFEADLGRIFGEELLADFSVLWLHAHATRFKPGVSGPASCILETWHQASQEEGSRVRDSLRVGVERAMVELGSGFLEHRANQSLRDSLKSGAYKVEAYHQEILRLVYRMLFLLAVEDRRQLHPPGATKEQLELYAQGYSLTRLRTRCLKHTGDRHDDNWDSLRVAFAGLAKGQSLLALPALGGIFDEGQCPTLERSHISNRRLLAAVRSLTWFRENDALVPINYRAMGTEELGSVYESLLELTPFVDETGRGFAFVKPDEGANRGNKRKTSGSYYTPDSLVQLLIKTTLDPVMADRLRGKSILAEQESALLSIKVLDPACGSGHFLLGAARRLADKLSNLRTEAGQDKDDRKALRDVISSCIHGVDRNPMAVELAKVALWLEGHVHGKPLGFLDANLVVGDSILSVVDTQMARRPIWAKAFEANEGEDEETCKQLARRNRAGSEQMEVGGLGLFTANNLALGDLYRGVQATNDDTLDGVRAKARAYADYGKSASTSADVILCHLYLAAYIGKRMPGVAVPTTNEIFAFLNGEDCSRYVEYAAEVAKANKVLIWPLAFPLVFQNGGFDVILANPPWERIALQEEEFFASRVPSIALAANQSERKRLIVKLSEAAPGTAEHAIYLEYQEAKRLIKATSRYAHDPARYPLSGRGIVNLYALFAENALKLLNERGRAGLITPTGLVTDANTSGLFGHLVANRKLAAIYDFENRKKLFSAVDSRFKFSLTSIGPSETSDCAFMLTDVSELTDSRRVRLSAEDFALVNPNTRTSPVVRTQKDLDLLKAVHRRLPILLRRDVDDNVVDNPWKAELFQLFNMSTNSKDFSKSPREGYVRLYESKMFHHYDHRWNSYAEDHWQKIGDEEEPGSDDDTGVGAEEEEKANVTLAQKQDPHFLARPRYWVPEVMLRSKLAPLPDKLCRAYRTGKGLERTFAQFAAAKLQSLGYGPTEFRSVCPWAQASGSFEELAAEGFDLAVNSNVQPDILLDSLRAKEARSSAEALFALLEPAWLIACRRITNTTNQRTLIASSLPTVGAGDSAALFSCSISPEMKLVFLAMLNSIASDYIVRQKLGGTTFSYNYIEQVPVIPPNLFEASDLSIVVPRALELVCTSDDMMKLYVDVLRAYPCCGRTHEAFLPFEFNPERRAVLKAELDAYFAWKMGFSRDDLVYILDPVVAMGEGYPSETFRGLRDAEIKEFGEYRTQRLVLEAWDRIVEPLRRGRS
jgi:hypothetical protein